MPMFTATVKVKLSGNETVTYESSKLEHETIEQAAAAVLAHVQTGEKWRAGVPVSLHVFTMDPVVVVEP